MLVQVSKIFELLRSQKPADESRRLAVQMLEEAVRAVCGTPWQVERQLKALNGTIAKIRAQEGRQEAAEADLALQTGLDRLEGKIALRVQEAVADGHKPSSIVCLSSFAMFRAALIGLPQLCVITKSERSSNNACQDIGNLSGTGSNSEQN
jgi:hypothetical protein